MKQLAERLDNELRYRIQPFGRRVSRDSNLSYDRELIDLLKREGVVDSDHLLRAGN